MSAEYTRKRQRSTSDSEEKLLDAFVSSCLSFKTNVTAFGAAEILTALPLASNILLLGTDEELHNAAQALPMLADATIVSAFKECGEGKTFGVTATIANEARRVTIGKVPSTASRHNAPLRPDAIKAIVLAALRDSSSVKALDVFVASKTENVNCIAAAVARGSTHSFSAKAGQGHTGSFASAAPTIRLFFPGDLSPSVKAELTALCTSIQLCMRLVDAPTNLLDTVTFTEIAVGLAKTYGLESNVISGEALREGGYGGIYGVGKGAEFPPALVTLTYKPKTPSGKKIALVGKGLVYDNGGLAIKTPYTNMCNMKTDMGGAAAVLCTILTIAMQNNSHHEISATLCIAENAIGPRSFRNDDILLLKSGLSIEVNNTDAEGRLVLSDGVYHAAFEQAVKPQTVITMATLTGAQLIATGKRHAAIYVSAEDAEAAVLKAGKISGDTCFPVLYCPEYHNEEFSSTVADYRNLMTQTNNAGISCAGQFIGNNLKDFDGTFIHVDLAGPSADANGGTGFGVALGYEYLLHHF